MRFSTGRRLLHRHFHGDTLAYLREVRMAGEDARGLRLWTPRGTPTRHRVTVDGCGLRDLPFREWVRQPTRMVTGRWDGGFHFLQLIPPAAAHAVWWMFGDDGRFRGWYVNLEEPGVRWDDGGVAGIDIVDQDLDIVVAPDRSWQWKDEDEFAERLAFPEHYWVRDTAAVRAEGERVVKAIESGGFPFDGTWWDLRPDPVWTVPSDGLPDGWDRPRAN
jgi:hypothetical protein